VGLVARGQIPPAEPVRPLVHEISGWGDKSRMSRETQVRFALTVGIGGLRAVLMLPQHTDSLFFRNPDLLHLSVLEKAGP
jgi:hypothetical protein